MGAESSFSTVPVNLTETHPSAGRERGRAYGLHADPRAGILSRRGARVARPERAAGLGRAPAARRGPPAPRGLRPATVVAAEDVRGRLRRSHVAEGGGRARAHLHGGD